MAIGVVVMSVGLVLYRFLYHPFYIQGGEVTRNVTEWVTT
jgi:hypothetical protein